MSLDDPYTKKSVYDKVVITPNDEIAMSKIRKGGAWELVEDFNLDIDASWHFPGVRSVLLRLFRGTAPYDEIVGIYKKAVEDNEMQLAQEQKRPPQNPFPFGDFKQRFIKLVMDLKVLDIIEQNAGESISSAVEKSVFTLTRHGHAFTRSKILDMIEKQNFGLFMIMLADPDKKVPLSYLNMKIIEQRKFPFDQLTALFDDLNNATVDVVIKEYTEYLKTVEGENAETMDEVAINNEVLKKLSELVGKGIVTILQDGKYNITKRGDQLMREYWRRVSNLFYFLRDAFGFVGSFIEMKEIGDKGRLHVWLTKEGIDIANGIRQWYENNAERLANDPSVLDDTDDHDVDTVLPIHQYAKQSKESKKKMQLSIYTVSEKRDDWLLRFKFAFPAIDGAAMAFSAGFLMFGLFVIFKDSGIGLAFVLIGVIGLAISMFLYPVSVKVVKASRNESEAKIIQKQFNERFGKNKKKKGKKGI